MKISAELQSLISNKTWYHQRFDGSPLFLYAIAEAELKKEPRKPAGTEADVRVSFFEEGKGDWYLEMSDIERGAAAIIELAKTDSGISKKLLAAWKDDEDRFEQFFWKEFPAIDLQSLSDEELIALWNRYTGLFSQRVSSSSIIDHFALGTDVLISTMIREEIGEEHEKEFTQVFSTATAPVHLSFINQAEIDLLSIAVGDSNESVEKYASRYFWLKNNYTSAQVLDSSHFQHEIDQWKQSETDLMGEIERVRSTPTENKRKKEEILKRFRFSPLLRTLITISEDFTWWQDERKRSTYFNTHIGIKLLEQVARRAGYAVEPLKYVSAPEIPTILQSKNPSLAELQKRRKGSVFIYTREGTIAITGPEVEEIRTLMLGSEQFDHIQDIRGLSASMGKAMGTAKVVKSVTEIAKVEKGDILVAVMTRPDYVPAMKKAAAIVTDEGGITSHAAIVSRELGIPCLIGTKIATVVFADGESVEVNANHGWARKVQKR